MLDDILYTLLMDNVTKREVEFHAEIKSLLDDCSNYELHLLVDFLKSSKEIIRKNQKYL